MLTCKVGEEIIKVFETDESLLRVWSKNGDMTCCSCENRIVYNHGEVRDFVYLRHFRKEDNCDYEKDCKEHDEGKLMIYNYLKHINGISNVDIEKRIPETNQIADIYFEYDDRKIAIEFQCTPIATPLLQRSRKYKNAGYEVIWIFGTENYNVYQYTKENLLPIKIEKYKTIASEREIMFDWDMPILYFDVNRKTLYQVSIDKIKSIPKRTTMFDLETNSVELSEFDIINFLNNKPLKEIKRNIYKWINKKELIEIIELHNLDYKIVSPTVSFKINNTYYAVEYVNKLIKEEEYENIVSYYKSNGIIPIIIFNAILYNVHSNKNYITYHLIGSYYFNFTTGELNILKHIGTETWGSYYGYYNMQKYDTCTSKLENCFIVGRNIENDKSSEYGLKEAITNTTKEIQKDKDKLYHNQYTIYERELKKYKDELKKKEEQERLDKINEIIKNVKDEHIVLIDGFYKIPNDIRFKFMRNFNLDDANYVYGEFVNSLKLLKSMKVKTLYLMIPKEKYYHSYIARSLKEMKKLKHKLNKYGFTNVDLYENKKEIKL